MSAPCNNYYASLSGDTDMSNDKMDNDMSAKEIYDEFDNGVEPRKYMFSYPQIPPMMPLGLTQEHTDYNTHQDQCWAGSGNHI